MTVGNRGPGVKIELARLRVPVPAVSLESGSATEVALAVQPAPALPGQMAEIRVRSREVARQHRAASPQEDARERIGVLARDGGEVLQERVIEIVYLLQELGPLRYNELRRTLGAISTRTLADKLAFLHARGLVERRMHDESPPRVEYSLTERGQALADLLFPALLLASGETGLLAD